MAESVSTTEASTHFLNSLDPNKARDERPAVERFIEWVGADSQMADLDARRVAEYARNEGEGNGDGTALEPVRAFLAYSARMAFTETDLVPDLHLGGGGANLDPDSPDAYRVTIEGLALLEQQVEELKARRPDIAEALRAAMEDKDFRENAPLDAARDEQAHLEARIREIEDQLRRAVIIDEDSKAGRANVGSTVKVRNLDSESEQTFYLVSPAEVDPGSGKISIESPFGAAVINRGPGDEVTVHAPAGAVRLKVLEVVG